MIDTLYVEDAVREHPRTQAILQRFRGARVVPCTHHGEVFNRHSQNFRIQKQRPALILAEKHGRRVLPVPPDNALDGEGYYFSHMLNCLYDCRYCFLQGMFRSAHYLLWVNYEDFVADIRAVRASSRAPVSWFFSGYDGDSLALEPVSGFAGHFIPALAGVEGARLELRTKSTQVRGLLEQAPQDHVVCAFSISPAPVAAALEHRAPTTYARLEAAAKLQRRGWQVGLRFDPLILTPGFRADFESCLEAVDKRLAIGELHSITLGAFRLPVDHAERIKKLYPEEPLFAAEFEMQAGVVSYPESDRSAMLDWCHERLAARAARVPIYRQG